MRVVVPFDAREPKTRLGPVLDGGERAAFARAMLRDVLETVHTTGRDPEVLANAPVDVDATVTVDERPLTDAVNAVLGTGDGDREAVAVVMADLALATPAALDRLFAADGEVVLAPGLGGGTNALVARHPEFRVDYHGASVRDHREAARDLDASLSTVDSFRLAVDVDEPPDLAELLLHGSGRSRAWLRDREFEVALDEGRVGVRRNAEP